MAFVLVDSNPATLTIKSLFITPWILTVVAEIADQLAMLVAGTETLMGLTVIPVVLTLTAAREVNV
jgi:hypothetical protein